MQPFFDRLLPFHEVMGPDEVFVTCPITGFDGAEVDEVLFLLCCVSVEAVVVLVCIDVVF